MKKIKVGGINYELIVKENLEDKNESVWGFVEYESSKIYVRSNISKQKKLQTVVHESLHAMLHESGLDDYANDEKIVTPLSNMLHQFIVDNPSLLNEFKQ
ncbi:ImmA/IrrE family metallo-endopeptidase [Leuconostoc suionicum]|uniref:ImmA/IrrE family metallo-endopeptidase n=1 Tax=Leuconostoc suionicum TaxID=1511761 RepID=UPI0032DEE982